ncbi:hypothetical protein [Azotobacter beijerinckii]|uniref:DUF4145 domain-containing protein n=1 Tax=Azotobacter beijerinckii TaxID=170623 RepID=A0A1I3ZR27_9GAMM|nr:hypothetical protein [Azotobacter beijerinckii]SFK46009.1 hypothetical protein SAMN04244574_00698 [Azotobacter beijerinckii]
MIDSEFVIRDSIFEHEMFESHKSGNSSFGLEHIRRVEATWAFDASQIVSMLKQMESEGLVASPTTPDYWCATYKGLIERERRWQKRGFRHPSLDPGATDPRDVVIALLRSSGYELELGSNTLSLSEYQVGVYIWHLDKFALDTVIERLIDDGLIKRDRHIFNRDLIMVTLTADGLRYYAHTVVPRLGLRPPATILAAATPERLPFEELGLDPTLADNLRFRWEEATRCSEARAWLAATALYGSILEVVLPDWLGRHKERAMAAAAAPRDRRDSSKIFPLEKWSTSDLIKVAAELGFIDFALTRHAHALRESRNMIHPDRQLRERANPDADLTLISRQVVLAVLAALARATP